MVAKRKQRGIRELYMSDYGINHIEVEELVKFCQEARGKDLALLFQAAVLTNEDIAAELFTCLKLRIGYEEICKRHWIPMQRKDFQGYRRKTLETVERLLLMRDVEMEE